MGLPPRVHELGDINDAEELIRYAVASHLGRLKKRSEIDVTRDRIGKVIGKTGRGALSHALNNERFTDANLRRFDLAMTALGLEHAGGLSALAVRLRGKQDQRTPIGSHTPVSLHEGLLKQQPLDEGTVLHQADALVSQLQVAAELGRPVHRGRRDEIEQVVRRLILIGAAPPTRLNVEALIWLGTLSGYAFDEMAEQLERTVRRAPLGFRVWRAVTKSVLLSSSTSDKAAIDKLRASVARLLRDAEQLREDSLYPGRSLDLELAIEVPGDWWSMEGNQGDWPGRMLLDRARSKHATLRERGTAAHGYWQRVTEGRGPDRARAKAQLTELIETFETAADRPDIATGLRWTAATLRAVIEREEAVCNTWPGTEEPWFGRVMAAAEWLGGNHSIPDEVRPGTRKLFEHSLLQNAGVARRQAIDTIVAAGWAAEVGDALIEVLNGEEEESWLRIRALFALGFLQRRSEVVQDALVTACLRADQRLAECEKPGDHPALVTELHAALFSVGDCFGARGAETTARAVRELLRPVLVPLVTEPDRLAARETWPVARALAYLLTVTAQDRRTDEPDLAETLLRQLERHPDRVTRALCTWALSFRFDPRTGKVRPLLAAARLDAEGNYPDDPA